MYIRSLQILSSPVINVRFEKKGLKMHLFCIRTLFLECQRVNIAKKISRTQSRQKTPLFPGKSEKGGESLPCIKCKNWEIQDFTLFGDLGCLHFFEKSCSEGNPMKMQVLFTPACIMGLIRLLRLCVKCMKMMKMSLFEKNKSPQNSYF